ncbi:MAG TPA: hypothetical protein VFW62_05000, partial [bacterium]|nr:hypothetical protein [bacterium]
TMDPKVGIGADLIHFNGERTYLADIVELPGVNMTPALRAELKKAEAMFEHGGGMSELRGKHIIIERVSGADTIQSHRASAEVAEFYKIWKAERGFTAVDSATANQAWGELQGRAKSLGIQITFGQQYHDSSLEKKLEAHGSVIVYLNELMKLLPDSMLANPHMKHIVLNVPRQGPGLLSSYDSATGTAYLYSGSFDGSRKYLSALFFHELGHSTSERYDTQTGDSSIPLAMRKKMHAAHRTLLAGKAMLGLDWANGAKGRAAYQESFVEFLAEMNLMYVTAGPKLRQHIESFQKGTPEREAWDFVYAEMRDRIFQGGEYGYTESAPTGAGRTTSSDLPSRDWNGFSENLQGAGISLNRLPEGENRLDVYVGDPRMMPADAGPAIVASAFASGETPRYWGALWQGSDGWRYYPGENQTVFAGDYSVKAREPDGGIRLAEGDVLTLGYHHFVYSKGELKLLADANQGGIPPHFDLHVPTQKQAAARGQAPDVSDRISRGPLVDPQILAGNVDFRQAIPIHKTPATSQNGEFSRATTQGLAY